MADTHDSTPRELDWSTAEVRDRQLKVDLTGDPSKTWKTQFEAVLRRLHQTGSAWGRVHPTKRRVTVAGVVPGHEAELRHLLEAAVLQTNADLAADPAPRPGDASPVDAEMTDAFRRLPDAPAD
ncbi:MAG TPA: hypothetical protein VIJ51_12280 [Solirubrobacteraceae bacterium]